MTEILGFIGTLLVAIAYIPQIIKLLRQKCAACISIPMWEVWTLATFLILIYAYSTDDLVFRVFTTTNGIAIALITLLAFRYRNRTCTLHTDTHRVHTNITKTDKKELQ